MGRMAREGIGMASGEKLNLLRTFLGSLPVGLAEGLARAVEVDRMNNGTGLPHDTILESLRPTLRDGDKNARALTPLRLFCRPFEDLLTNDQRSQKQKGRILRSSITPVWNWLAQDLLPEEAQAYAVAVKTAALGCGTDEVLDRAAAFWQAAAQALGERLATESGRRAAQRALKEEAAVADAQEMALMLGVGPDIYDLQQRLPQILPALTEDVVKAFRDTYDRLMQTAPDAAPYLPLVVMSRLEKPWEALRLPLGAAGDTAEDSPAESDTGLAGEVLFATVEAHSAAVRAATPHRFDADTLISHIEQFAELSNGVIKEVELRRDGVWGLRLVKDRATVAEAMDGFMQRTPQEIMAALPMRAEEDGSFRLPDISSPSDPEKSDRALCYARLLAGCRRFAGAASFGASLKRADEEALGALKTYNEEIVRGLRDLAEEERINAEQYAALATELTTILISHEQGEPMGRHGRTDEAPSMAA
jgi:hypothetical protein